MTTTDTHANRGRDLEYAVNQYFKRLRSIGIPCHQNHPRRLVDGTPAEKNDYDFEVLCEGRFYAFDAKQCDGAAWYPDKRYIHQEKALRDVSAAGGEGFFLVLFTRMKDPKTGRTLLVRFPVPLPVAPGRSGLKPSEGIILDGLDFLGVLARLAPPG